MLIKISKLLIHGLDDMNNNWQLIVLIYLINYSLHLYEPGYTCLNYILVVFKLLLN